VTPPLRTDGIAGSVSISAGGAKASTVKRRSPIWKNTPAVDVIIAAYPASRPSAGTDLEEGTGVAEREPEERGDVERQGTWVGAWVEVVGRVRMIEIASLLPLSPDIRMRG